MKSYKLDFNFETPEIKIISDEKSIGILPLNYNENFISRYIDGKYVYVNLWDDIDVLYEETSDNNIKEYIQVNSQKEDFYLEFQIDKSGIDFEKINGVVFLTDKNNRPYFSFDNLVVFDKHGEIIENAIKCSIDVSTSIFRIVCSKLDDSLYPICIDPSIVVIPPRISPINYPKAIKNTVKIYPENTRHVSFSDEIELTIGEKGLDYSIDAIEVKANNRIFSLQKDQFIDTDINAFIGIDDFGLELDQSQLPYRIYLSTDGNSENLSKVSQNYKLYWDVEVTFGSENRTDLCINNIIQDEIEEIGLLGIFKGTQWNKTITYTDQSINFQNTSNDSYSVKVTLSIKDINSLPLRTLSLNFKINSTSSDTTTELQNINNIKAFLSPSRIDLRPSDSGKFTKLVFPDKAVQSKYNSDPSSFDIVWEAFKDYETSSTKIKTNTSDLFTEIKPLYANQINFTYPSLLLQTNQITTKTILVIKCSITYINKTNSMLTNLNPCYCYVTLNDSDELDTPYLIPDTIYAPATAPQNNKTSVTLVLNNNDLTEYYNSNLLNITWALYKNNTKIQPGTDSYLFDEIIENSLIITLKYPIPTSLTQINETYEIIADIKHSEDTTVPQYVAKGIIVPATFLGSLGKLTLSEDIIDLGPTSNAKTVTAEPDELLNSIMSLSTYTYSWNIISSDGNTYAFSTTDSPDTISINYQDPTEKNNRVYQVWATLTVDPFTTVDSNKIDLVIHPNIDGIVGKIELKSYDQDSSNAPFDPVILQSVDDKNKIKTGALIKLEEDNDLKILINLLQSQGIDLVPNTISWYLIPASGNSSDIIELSDIITYDINNNHQIYINYPENKRDYITNNEGLLYNLYATYRTERIYRESAYLPIKFSKFAEGQGPNPNPDTEGLHVKRQYGTIIPWTIKNSDFAAALTGDYNQYYDLGNNNLISLDIVTSESNKTPIVAQKHCISLLLGEKLSSRYSSNINKYGYVYLDPKFPKQDINNDISTTASYLYSLENNATEITLKDIIYVAPTTIKSNISQLYIRLGYRTLPTDDFTYIYQKIIIDPIPDYQVDGLSPKILKSTILGVNQSTDNIGATASTRTNIILAKQKEAYEFSIDNENDLTIPSSGYQLKMYYVSNNVMKIFYNIYNDGNTSVIKNGLFSESGLLANIANDEITYNIDNKQFFNITIPSNDPNEIGSPASDNFYNDIIGKELFIHLIQIREEGITESNIAKTLILDKYKVKFIPDNSTYYLNPRNGDLIPASEKSDSLWILSSMPKKFNMFNYYDTSKEYYIFVLISHSELKNNTYSNKNIPKEIVGTTTNPVINQWYNLQVGRKIKLPEPNPSNSHLLKKTANSSGTETLDLGKLTYLKTKYKTGIINLKNSSITRNMVNTLASELYTELGIEKDRSKYEDGTYIYDELYNKLLLKSDKFYSNSEKYSFTLKIYKWISPTEKNDLFFESLSGTNKLDSLYTTGKIGFYNTELKLTGNPPDNPPLSIYEDSLYINEWNGDMYVGSQDCGMSFVISDKFASVEDNQVLNCNEYGGFRYPGDKKSSIYDLTDKTNLRTLIDFPSTVTRFKVYFDRINIMYHLFFGTTDGLYMFYNIDIYGSNRTLESNTVLKVFDPSYSGTIDRSKTIIDITITQPSNDLFIATEDTVYAINEFYLNQVFSNSSTFISENLDPDQQQRFGTITNYQEYFVAVLSNSFTKNYKTSIFIEEAISSIKGITELLKIKEFPDVLDPVNYDRSELVKKDSEYIAHSRGIMVTYTDVNNKIYMINVLFKYDENKQKALNYNKDFVKLDSILVPITNGSYQIGNTKINKPQKDPTYYSDYTPTSDINGNQWLSYYNSLDDAPIIPNGTIKTLSYESNPSTTIGSKVFKQPGISSKIIVLEMHRKLNASEFNAALDPPKEDPYLNQTINKLGDSKKFPFFNPLVGFIPYHEYDNLTDFWIRHNEKVGISDNKTLIRVPVKKVDYIINSEEEVTTTYYYIRFRNPDWDSQPYTDESLRDSDFNDLLDVEGYAIYRGGAYVGYTIYIEKFEKQETRTDNIQTTNYKYYASWSSTKTVSEILKTINEYIKNKDIYLIHEPLLLSYLVYGLEIAGYSTDNNFAYILIKHSPTEYIHYESGVANSRYFMGIDYWADNSNGSDIPLYLVEVIKESPLQTLLSFIPGFSTNAALNNSEEYQLSITNGGSYDERIPALNPDKNRIVLYAWNDSIKELNFRSCENYFNTHDIDMFYGNIVITIERIFNYIGKSVSNDGTFNTTKENRYKHFDTQDYLKIVEYVSTEKYSSGQIENTYETDVLLSGGETLSAIAKEYFTYLKDNSISIVQELYNMIRFAIGPDLVTELSNETDFWMYLSWYCARDNDNLFCFVENKLIKDSFSLWLSGTSYNHGTYMTELQKYITSFRLTGIQQETSLGTFTNF